MSTAAMIVKTSRVLVIKTDEAYLECQANNGCLFFPKRDTPAHFDCEKFDDQIDEFEDRFFLGTKGRAIEFHPAGSYLVIDGSKSPGIGNRHIVDVCDDLETAMLVAREFAEGRD